jgi:hypothetical protein
VNAGHVWRRWVAFWDRREGPESLALARMLVGSVLFWDFAGMASAGLVPDFWLAPPRGLGWGGVVEASGFVHALGASPGLISALWALALAGSFGVAVGLWLRPAALACVTATALLGRLAPDGERAIDVLLRIVLIVFALSRADATWSLGSALRRRRGHPAVTSIPAWPRLLLFAQVVWVYSSAAQTRGGVEWWPAGGCVALARVLSDPHFARFSPGWTAALDPLPRVATALTMLFELGSPLIAVFTVAERRPERFGAFGRAVRRLHLRWLWLGLGASLHLGIALTMRLGIFPFGMLALYPLFLAPEELRAGLAWLRRSGARCSAAKAPG